MSQNTVLESQGDFPLESTSHTVPPTPAVLPPLPANAGPAPAADPVRSLTEAWYASAPSDAWTPVRRPFDAQYWACWFVAIVLPLVLAYLLLTR